MVTEPTIFAASRTQLALAIMAKKSSKKLSRESRSNPKGALTMSQPKVIDRLEIIKFYHANGQNQTHTAKHFQANGFPSLSQSTVSRFVRDEDKWHHLAESASMRDVVRVRPARHPLFDAALSMWIDQMEAAKFNGLTGDVIRTIALLVYDKLEVPKHSRTELSEGWLTRFKARNNLRFHRFHSESAAISVEDVHTERARLRVLLSGAFDNGYDMNDFDETSFFYASVPDRGLAREARSGGKGSKTRITLALGTNATGTDKLPPLFIGHAKQLRSFSAPPRDLGYDYASSEKAWMTGDIFRAWMLRLQRTMAHKKRHIILFVDNFSGHKSSPKDTPNIRLEFFSANLTAH
ncbi:tigger transposable element derived 6-like, partial [Achlya hypogyna]